MKKKNTIKSSDVDFRRICTKKNYDTDDDFEAYVDLGDVDEVDGGWYFADGEAVNWSRMLYMLYPKRKELKREDKDYAWWYRCGEDWDGKTQLTFHEIALAFGEVKRIEYKEYDEYKGTFDVPNNLRLFKALCYAVGESFGLSVVNNIEIAECKYEEYANNGCGCSVVYTPVENKSEEKRGRSFLNNARKAFAAVGIKVSKTEFDGENLRIDANWDDNRHNIFHDYCEYFVKPSEIDKYVERDNNYYIS